MSGPQRDLQFSTYGHGHGQYIHFKSKEDPRHDFLIPPPSLGHLNHENEFTSVSFDAPTLYMFSTSSSPPYTESPELPPSPDSASSPESSLPELYSRKPATRLRSGNRVPRPRNAFMIFRSEFWAREKISSSVERDHRHISRIIGHCWNQLSEAEKDVWRRKAEREKVEHSLRYPGYRFSPTIRTKKAVKRKVKRNGKEELLRCRQVAALILAGKEGEELDTAVKSLSIPEPQCETSVCKGEQVGQSSTLTPLSNVIGLQPQLHRWNVPSNMEVPVFRSPLLPPIVPSDGGSTCIDNVEPLVAATYPPSQYDSYQASEYSPEGGYVQYPCWNIPAHTDSQVYEGEHYTVDGSSSNVTLSPMSMTDVVAHPTYYQFQHYEVGHTPYVEYSPALPSASTSHVAFRNPFEFPSAYLPYANQPRASLDLLQWDLTGFTT